MTLAGSSYREQRARERKQDILVTAAEVFEEKGFHGATIEEIAGRLKLTKGSIYYYVNSKQELLYQCHSVAMSMLLRRLREVMASGGSAGEKLHRAIVNHVEVLTDEISMITVALQQEYALSPEYREKIVRQRDEYDRLLIEIIQEGIDAGTFRPVDARMVRFIILGAINWIPHWYSQKGKLSKREIAEFFADYLVGTLRAPAG